MPGRLLDANAAADYLGVTTDQLRGLVFRRQVPFMKVGRSLRFDIRRLDRWIEDGHRATGKAS